MSSVGFDDSDFADVEWAAPPAPDRTPRSTVFVWTLVLASLAAVPGLAWGIHLIWGSFT